MWLVIKEHFEEMSAMEQLTCESMNPVSMCCSSCYSTAGSFVFPLRLNLYLGCVCLRMVLIVSMLRLGFVERQAERALVWALQLLGARSKSLVEAKSFDMEHLQEFHALQFTTC